MSEKDRDSGDAASDIPAANDEVETSAESSTPEPENDVAEAVENAPQPQAAAQPGRAGGLALLLSLVALGLAGWLAYERFVAPPEAAPQPFSAADLDAIETRLDEFAAQAAGAGEDRQQLLARQSELASELEAVSARLGGQLADLDSRLEDQFGEQLDARLDQRLARESADLRSELQRDMAQLSEEFDGLARRLAEAIDAWSDQGEFEHQVERDLGRQIAMLEAASLLRIGQERAELVGDLRGARLAYQRADELLARVDDVRLDRVRRSLARELEAIDSIDSLDLSQSLARLDRLARDARHWPTQLGQVSPLRQQPESADDASDEHWRDRLTGVARNLVRVQARDDLGRSDEQFDTARELLQLRLVAAQLALTRRDADAMAVQLGAAAQLLDDWFDPEASEVRQARSDLEALGGLRFDPEIPELGEALNRLQSLLGAP